MKKENFLLIILLTVFPNLSFPQTGNLDSTFDSDGKLTTAIDSGAEAFSVAIQSDGKIVAAGFSSNNTTNGDFTLVRYNIDGTPDSSFSADGKVTTAIGYYSQAYSVAIQPDRKIVAAGYTWDGIAADFALARYNADGTLDSSFGTDGEVITSIGVYDDIAYSVVIQPDGKIVVAGYTVINAFRNYFALVRYKNDGTVDSSFGTNGKVTTSIGSIYFDEAYSVAIQSDGKIVAAGYTSNATDGDFGLVRYNIDGSLDNSFGTDGKVATAIGMSNDFAYSVAIQPDGKIVAAGQADINTPDFALVRYNTDGTLDNSFGTGGKVTTDFGPIADWATSVALEPDGKIVAAGFLFSGADEVFALAQYNADGTLDKSFGAEGMVKTSFGLIEDKANSVVIQSDGKIVAAGYSDASMTSFFAIARYLSDLNTGIINFSSLQTTAFIYPNPIQSTAVLRFTLLRDEVLTLSLYDISGKLVKNFFTHEKRSTGEHKEELHIGNIPAGNYFLTLSNGKQKVSVKMVKQ